MFETVDALNRGKHFLTSLCKARPFPFALESADVAVLLGAPIDGKQLAIMIAKNEFGDGEDRVVVQIRDVPSNETLLLATLTVGFDFVSASAMGCGVDEVGAVDLLMLYVPLIDGEWSLEGAALTMVGEEQNDGSSAAEESSMA